MKIQFKKIAATFKANKCKPSYWVQLIGSLLVIGVLVAHYVFGVSINSDAVLGVTVMVGSLIAVWGNLTDNSILEQTGETLKESSSSYVKTADDVANAIDTAMSAASSAVSQAESATSMAKEAASSATQDK